MASNQIKVFIENSILNRSCSIQPLALDHFVEIWENLYGYTKLNTLDKYIEILFREYAYSVEAYEFSFSDIDHLDEDYIELEYMIWNELKDRPDLVEELVKVANLEDVDFVSEEKYESWLRLSL
jgi:hypothetical protein